MPQPSTDMLVYRDGQTPVLANARVNSLESTLAGLQNNFTEEALLSALLRAGELECALCDADCPDTASANALTDQLAGMACHADLIPAGPLQACHQRLSSIRHEGELTMSRPEGFAYYALHPLDFADLATVTGLRPPGAYVVGIRSIGSTLSAVVAARLNAEGVPSSRTTVRPVGHPYDRQTAFTALQRDAIRHKLSRGALFLVCDEGPGRSGSSLLSVAEALEREGVSRDHIVLLSSHQPDVDALCAQNAAERWRRYRNFAIGMTKRLPRGADRFLSADDGRELFNADRDTWPAAWPQMEPLKFLSSDRQQLFQFEGHGPYGEAVRERQQLLAASGFGPRYFGHDAGFGIQEVVGGKKAGIATPSLGLLRHVAKYCAWRAETLPATISQHNIRQLERMATFNAEQEFGFAPELHLAVERPVICDGHMQDYTWRELSDGHWIKVDASTHGDDHFFPGPTDIAWDLAGVCVEWQLSADHREFLLSEYRRMSGDNPTARLPEYEIAYSAFRLGWSRMAAGSVCDAEDNRRLMRDAGRYRGVLDRVLAASQSTR